MSKTTEKIHAWDASLTLTDQGPSDASAVLVLHGEEGPASFEELVAGLAESHRVIAPIIPGFGGESRVPGADRPRELAYLFLDLLDVLGIGQCAIVGSSLGAWIALEMAAMEPRRFSSVAVISPLGLKFGGRTDRTFAEILVDAPDHVAGLLYADTERSPWLAVTETDDIVRRAEQRESFMHYTWEPYMHNPALKPVLARITVPALVLTGSSDGLVDSDYYAQLVAALPEATLESVDAAGHYPEIEQPVRTSELVQKFIS